MTSKEKTSIDQINVEKSKKNSFYLKKRVDIWFHMYYIINIRNQTRNLYYEKRNIF